MTKGGWTAEDIPDQKGKLAVVTGATGGLGYETALALAQKGATVILLGRNDQKGKDALDKIKAAVPNADVSFEKADLGSLKAIEAFSKRFYTKHDSLDMLINNAGIMAIPERKTTEDGFEMQLGTNHLSHFALTSHLLPALKKSQHPRVVNVSSIAHRGAKINFDDLMSEKSYSQWPAYGQSKLANLLFTMELQKKSDEKNWGLHCTSSHPGIATTDLIENGPGSSSWSARIMNNVFHPLFGQPAAQGALPSLYGATSPDAVKGEYYGPNGFKEFKGVVAVAKKDCPARNEEAARKLWEISTTLTGANWD